MKNLLAAQTHAQQHIMTHGQTILTNANNFISGEAHTLTTTAESFSTELAFRLGRKKNKNKTLKI